MKSARLFLVGLAALASCAAAPAAVDSAEQGLFHTFDCSATTPAEYGYADAFALPGYNPAGGCVRVRGDVLRGSASAGYAYTAPWPIKSIRLSTVDTRVQACKGVANGPSYSPCNGDINTKFVSSAGPVFQLPYIAWPPAGAGSGAMVVGFPAQPPPSLCPYVTESFPHPGVVEQCGTFSPAGVPNVIARAAPGDTPIVGNVATGAPCSCPHDAVIPLDSQCNYYCP